MWRKIDGKKREKGAKSDGKKDGNMQLLEACKPICKGRKSAKSAGKKARQSHLLKACETTFKYDGKKGVKRRGKAGKGTERKMGSMHLLEAGKASFK
jgi:hypothetical protein